MVVGTAIFRFLALNILFVLPFMGLFIRDTGPKLRVNPTF